MTRKILSVLAFSAALLSGQTALEFDPATTKINWSLAGNVHTTHGTFQLKEGRVDVDPGSGGVSGELVVASGSGESGNGSRDKKMNKEVLESDKYPEIRLKVTKVEGALPLATASNVRVFGQLTIHGASHEVSLPVQFAIKGDEFSGRGKLVVPYVDWGMKDPSNFLFKVNKTVEIEFLGAGRLKH